MNIIDGYSLRARLIPVIIVLIPIPILGLLYTVSMKSLTPVIASGICVSSIAYLFSHLGRTYGKKKEPQLWMEWGGSPSIQILRWRNSVIDPYTKKRYHDRLQQLAPVPTQPDHTFETANPTDADLIYSSWNRYLLAHSRDKIVFSLLLKENASYGFRRNMWGLKSFAMVLLIIALLCSYVYNAYTSRSWNPLLFTTNFFIGLGIILPFYLFWIFCVTKMWVKSAADAYALRLIETCNVI
jgi:hypothetical protein